tara:strand:- start:1665 stop:2612 length:948 start_codon:yes stop_codon:yes gene_type:complete
MKNVESGLNESAVPYREERVVVDLEIRELLIVLWLKKWLFILVAFVAAITSVLFSLNLPDEYSSQAILSPASSSSSPVGGMLGSQLGGLASLAGVNIGGGDSVGNVVEALELVNTWAFLGKIIEQHGLATQVLAVKGWDRDSKTLIYDEKVYDSQAADWRAGKKPSSWQLYSAMKERISVVRKKENGLVYVKAIHFSPLVARQWVNLIVSQLNSHFQLKDRDEANASIAYLKLKAAETPVAEMQSVFYQLIEEQTKTLMLAEISSEYVFKTVSPPFVAEEKSKPKRSLIVVLSTLFSLFLALLFTLSRFLLLKGR